ncbi:MAG: hypothetical protein SNJ50_07975 [Cyanobacteriota bacterium]
MGILDVTGIRRVGGERVPQNGRSPTHQPLEMASSGYVQFCRNATRTALF